MMSSELEILKQRFDEGELNIDNHLPYSIKESWLRCKNNSIDMKGGVEFNHLNKSRFEQVKYDSRLLINSSKKPLESLHKSVADFGCSILLTDTNCNTLQVMRSSKIVNDQLFIGFENGVTLDEDRVGTTAMSCSIHSKQFTRVFGNEHYKDTLVGLNCAALPILSSQGIVIGSINITNENPLDDPAVFYMLKNCAQNIQKQLICSIPETLIIELTLSSGQFGELSNLLIAVAPDTSIIGCNEPARRFLFNDCFKDGQLFSAIFETPFSDVLNLGIAKEQTFKLRVHSGIVLCAKVIQSDTESKLPTPTPTPTQKILTQVKTETKKPSVYFGDPDITKNMQSGTKVISRLPIILFGESGVGKEISAQYLHDESQCSGKFISINCASIPETLIESELFGYQSGAFTGADKKGNKGRIVDAHNGTLFLDEIGDMPLVMQSRLLRVLETRKVSPLGSSIEKDVNFQLICATNVDLEKLVESGDFRKDLYYRIKGFAINILPLRSRADKVGIAEIIMARDCQNKTQLDESTQHFIDTYDWPGNIRELRNVLLYADAMNEGDERIFLHELPDEYHQLVDTLPHQVSASLGKKIQGKIDVEMEKLISTSLKQCKGNVSEAAKWLGISRATLYRKLSKK